MIFNHGTPTFKFWAITKFNCYHFNRFEFELAITLLLIVVLIAASFLKSEHTTSILC